MTRKKTVKQKTANINASNVKWYVLRGFMVDNKDETGFLSIDTSKTSSSPYRIVDDIQDAMKFPSKNIYNTNGFGTPQQWLKFFKDEPELVDWKFHLVTVNGMQS